MGLCMSTIAVNALYLCFKEEHISPDNGLGMVSKPLIMKSITFHIKVNGPAIVNDVC